MDAAWSSAAFQPEYTVLRLRLRPFSCGHEILLGMLDSPIVIGGTPDWNDLFTAVLICSQSFDDGLRIIRRPKKFNWFGRIWRLLIGRKADLAAELAKFRTYLQAGLWSPETLSPVKGIDMRTLKAPRAFRLVWFLCAEMRLTEAEALDYSVARANVYYAAAADKRGEVDLMGDDDRALIQRAKELDEREARGEIVWPSD